ncbi:MAG: hypothetical protein ACI867_001006 [Glaciecola sp.]|jgi:hypothetical protein
MAQADLDDLATEEELAVLAHHQDAWIEALRELLDSRTGELRRFRANVHGPERAFLLDDFEQEESRVRAQLAALVGDGGKPNQNERRAPVTAAPVARAPEPEQEMGSGTPQLQLSWHDGCLVAWAAGQSAHPEPRPAVLERLAASGANPAHWQAHDGVRLRGQMMAEAVTAPGHVTLGWLVSLASQRASEATISDDSDRGTILDPLAPSVLWLGAAAAMAVRLAAQGRMVPQLERVLEPGSTEQGNRASANGRKTRGGRGEFRVNWAPALIDRDELGDLAKGLPGAVSVLDGGNDPRAFTRKVIGAFIDVICGDAASRMTVPEPSPRPVSASDVGETFLARMSGTTFEAPIDHGLEVSRGMQRWGKAITAPSKLRLVVELDPPDEGGTWHLRTLADDGNGTLESVESVMSNGANARRLAIKRDLDRLERLFPVLERVKARRRGEVIMDQGEAWEFMTKTGPVLKNAGFDVRVPPLSRKKPKPMLRLTSFNEADSAVGAQQLTAVSWSAVFGDQELSAAEIRELAAQSRPLVRSHGRWVEVDRADLVAAAEALEERANQTHLSGADMFRMALGLDDGALAVTIAGENWAAKLLASAGHIPDDPTTRPEGFNGELRSYQANALAWLGFLDQAGLGGCLALDMGLGKTPTLLAHVQLTIADGPALVVAPPAVVGNWALEARKFVPGLRVLVHHGANRDEGGDLKKAFENYDLIITTYGTAVRDIEALEELHFNKVVLDEAQVIKNHTSETAQKLRLLKSRTRVVLTGTPIENGLGDLWALMDFVNPGLVGERSPFVAQLSATTGVGSTAESALRMLNGVLVFRRTKSEPAIAAELPDRIDELAHCPMTTEQIGLYQAVLDQLVLDTAAEHEGPKKKGAVLAAITALKQICNHPAAYLDDDRPLDGRSGKLARLGEIIDSVYESGERALVFTHFAKWGEKLATFLTERTGTEVSCYHGGLGRGARDKMIEDFQNGKGPGVLVLSLKAGGTGLNLTAANHVVLYDRWWNPAVEDQARDRAWRIGQTKTVLSHRLVCPGTIDERVEEVVAGKRQIADMVLPKSSSVGDLDSAQLRKALGLDTSLLLTDEDEPILASTASEVKA